VRIRERLGRERMEAAKGMNGGGKGRNGIF